MLAIPGIAGKIVCWCAIQWMQTFGWEIESQKMGKMIKSEKSKANINGNETNSAEIEWNECYALLGWNHMRFWVISLMKCTFYIVISAVLMSIFYGSL